MLHDICCASLGLVWLRGMQEGQHTLQFVSAKQRQAVCIKQSIYQLQATQHLSQPRCCCCRCWDLLFAVCEVMQDINPVLEDQLQQQMRMECAASGPPLAQDSFTRFVMEK